MNSNWPPPNSQQQPNAPFNVDFSLPAIMESNNNGQRGPPLNPPFTAIPPQRPPQQSSVNPMTRPPQQFLPPQNLQGQRPPGSQSNEDLLARLVRAESSQAVKDSKDVALLHHILTCTHPRPCPYSDCDAGRSKLQHYDTCTTEECLPCVTARLFHAMEKRVVTDSDLRTRLNRHKLEMRNELENLKKANQDHERASKVQDTLLIKETAENIEKYKRGANMAKKNLIDVCKEVYRKWVSVKPKPHVFQGAPSSLPPFDLTRGAMSSSQSQTSTAPPEVSYQSAGFKSGPGLVPPHSNTSLPSAIPRVGSMPMVVAQQQQQQPPPRTISNKPDEAHGYLIEYAPFTKDGSLGSIIHKEGDVVNMAFAHEANEVLSDNAVGIKFTRMASDERSWVLNNVVNKSEVELEMQRQKKKARSHVEVEYLSQAAQELVTEMITTIRAQLGDKPTLSKDDILFFIDSRREFKILL